MKNKWTVKWLHPFKRKTAISTLNTVSLVLCCFLAFRSIISQPQTAGRKTLQTRNLLQMPPPSKTLSYISKSIERDQGTRILKRILWIKAQNHSKNGCRGRGSPWISRADSLWPVFFSGIIQIRSARLGKCSGAVCKLQTARSRSKGTSAILWRQRTVHPMSLGCSEKTSTNLTQKEQSQEPVLGHVRQVIVKFSFTAEYNLFGKLLNLH